MRILVVEDDDTLVEAIRYGLEREGFVITVARDGREALERFRAENPDLVLLDLMLPEVPGLDVCKAIRARSSVPIIIVSAKDAEADTVTGLEMGADDYMTKPFSMRELVARVRAVSRRATPSSAEPARLRAGPVEMDVGAHEVWIRNRRCDLPPKEFHLLHALLRDKGRLVTRDALVAEVWGPDYVGDTRTLDVHVKRLRAKIEKDPHQPRMLTTVRSLGYKLEDVTE